MTQLDALLCWFSELTPATIKHAERFYQPDAHFKDPFNDVRGIAAIEAIFTHMFATTENPRFDITQKIAQDQQAFVTWTFHFSLKGKAYAIEGVSHLLFCSDGLVTMHRDYWDTNEELFQKLPLIGGPVRWLRNQFMTPKKK
ncbi:nuclear transport factor 2 family protein [Glaciimonas soli]|uniref:Nuclear transport factor 2 family protein n=1 Tax=Glaciimonas soli TaxID=2590999 RepID=A0A843YP46_9BURK|nr:nuclear transport factor 2 family protein [Glaciimonas soli]MQQ99756.1 nuclear transport factor 2 family protein [Glaciimonas soli]